MAFRTICPACGAAFPIAEHEPGTRCIDTRNLGQLTAARCPGRLLSETVYASLAFEYGITYPADAPPFPSLAYHMVDPDFWITITDDEGFLKVLKDNKLIESWAWLHREELLREYAATQAAQQTAPIVEPQLEENTQQHVQDLERELEKACAERMAEQDQQQEEVEDEPKLYTGTYL